MDVHSDRFKELRRRARKQINNDKGLIEQLTQVRKGMHVSQEELAFRMGVTQPAISAIEKGNSDPNLGTIRRYANALGLIVSYKIEQSDESWAPIPESNTCDTGSETDRDMFSTVAERSDYQAISFVR